MKITLVRHGETDFNKEGKIQGLSNNLLNDTGRRQCRDLRMRLSDKHFDYCYMSPLVRTVETAMILIGDRVEMIPDKRLIERDMGELEGKSRDEYDFTKSKSFLLSSCPNSSLICASANLTAFSLSTLCCSSLELISLSNSLSLICLTIES